MPKIKVSRSVELTEKQMEALQEVENHKDEKGFPPTVRELAKRLGITAKPAKQRLDALERKGVIERDGSPRGIRTLEYPNNLSE